MAKYLVQNYDDFKTAFLQLCKVRRVCRNHDERVANLRNIDVVLDRFNAWCETGRLERLFEE